MRSGRLGYVSAVRSGRLGYVSTASAAEIQMQAGSAAQTASRAARVYRLGIVFSFAEQ